MALIYVSENKKRKKPKEDSAVYARLFEDTQNIVDKINKMTIIIGSTNIGATNFAIFRENIMKYLRQFLLILFISFLGEVLKYLLPFPIPASIYGMVLLFIGLLSGIIKIEAVRDVGKFLIETMPVMFIPAGVGLMASWGTLKPVLLPVSVITLVVLILVFGATGRTSQLIIRMSKKKEERKPENE